MDLDADTLSGLQLLAENYPSISAASTEIINLRSQLNLASGTEHFVSDVHGEYDMFSHVLRNGSGTIRQAIKTALGGTLSDAEQHDIAKLIYYPKERMSLVLATIEDHKSWLRHSLQLLVRVCRECTSRYTRSKVRQLMPQPYVAILEDLLYEYESSGDRLQFYRAIVDSVVETNSARAVISALAQLIQSLAISRLHVIGDIFDRGPAAERIMDALIAHHSVDIQWGNHDIVWMGAAAGSEACIANVIRIALRYANLDTLESGYSISLLSLASFAFETYADDPCERFQPKLADGHKFSTREISMLSQMHKAIAIIQLKLEGQIIQRRPQYRMQDRLLLEKIDHSEAGVKIDGVLHPLLDAHFPTIDPDDPYRLTEAEQGVVKKLRLAFANSARLQKHVRFLYSRGGMYLVHNGNLLYHGCVAMNEDGSFKPFEVAGETYAGKAFLDRVERLARQGYFAAEHSPERSYGQDAMWYLWSGEQSPLFGKQKMATFERYFIADKSTHREGRNAYYQLRNEEEVARRVLSEFEVDPDNGRIVNGHVPVKVVKGESPIKANGKLLVIDGGFSKAYRKETGIAGYTLISSAQSLQLVAHQPFESIEEYVAGGPEDEVEVDTLEELASRRRVADTDDGVQIQARIDILQQLVNAYRDGFIKES